MSKGKKLSPQAFEELSAYIDGQVTAQEAQEIEAKLARSIELQQAHDQIKALRTTVRAMPMRKAPRNFILTRAEAVEAKRGHNWQRAFGLAFSLSAVFLVALFGFDGVRGGVFSAKEVAAPQVRDAMPHDAPAPQILDEIVPPSSDKIALAELPVEDAEDEIFLLNWGSPEGLGGGGNGEEDDKDGSRDLFTTYASGGGSVSINQSDPKPEDIPEVYVNTSTGEVTQCDPVYGCGFGGDYTPGSESVEEKPDEYLSAMPLIFGLDAENQGNVIGISPVIEEQSLSTATADELPEESTAHDIAESETKPIAESVTASEEAQTVAPDSTNKPALSENAGKYDFDIDHQTYFRDQIILWLKISLSFIGLLSGLLCLILRRR